MFSTPSIYETLLDGDLLYYPSFLSFDTADTLFCSCLSLPHWQQETIRIYGRDVLTPRQQIWLGQKKLKYRYSGRSFVSIEWPESIAKLSSQISGISGAEFNSVLGNLYRDGQDCMGWHADDEPELGPAPVIASLSLGAERDFTLRRKGSTRQSYKLSLAHGSLLIMQAGMQDRWQHAVPRRAGIHTPRVNLTFRHITEKIQPEF